MIHEALHVLLDYNDTQLAGWLENFGFTPSGTFNSGEITNWIVGTKNQMDTNGGCNNPDACNLETIDQGGSPLKHAALFAHGRK